MTAADCRRCHSPLAREDLRCAVCALPVPADEVAAIPTELAQVLRCNGCGAAVSYQADVGAPRCDFCGSVMELETPEDPIEQAEVFLRFTVGDAQARDALRAWLGNRGFFRPGDLAQGASLQDLKPLWWAGWVFEAEGTMSWAGDSDAGSRRSAWAPHAGQAPLHVRNVIVSGSRGLTEAECRTLTPHYDLANATDHPEGHPKATVEQFAVQRSAARQIITRALHAVALQRAIDQIPGTKHREMKAAVLPTRLVSRHYAFPAFVLAYRYGGALYRVVVHGQNAACVMGEAPLSWRRIAMVVGIAVAIVVVLALIFAH